MRSRLLLLGFGIAMSIAPGAFAQNVAPVARPSKPYVRGAIPTPVSPAAPGAIPPTARPVAPAVPSAPIVRPRPVAAPAPLIPMVPAPAPAPVPAPRPLIPMVPAPAPAPRPPVPTFAAPAPAPAPTPIATPGTVARPSRPRFPQRPVPVQTRPAARPRRMLPAQTHDGPMLAERIDPNVVQGADVFDEPETPASNGPFRFALSFGGSSLVVDPDMEVGIGGGLELAAWLSRRFGLELSAFGSQNAYKEGLGDTGIAFWVVNVTLGPTIRLTSPSSEWLVSLDGVFGGYMVISPLQESTWTTGIGGGITIGKQLTRWMSVGIRARYHVFNISHLSGPEIIDIKALRPVAMVDRLEVPAYVAFHF